MYEFILLKSTESRARWSYSGLGTRDFLYCTFSVMGKEYVRGFVPPVVALIVTGYVPAGVPGFFWELLLLLPPQAPIHSVEKPKTTIRLSRRAPRLREPAAKTIPNRPGSSIA